MAYDFKKLADAELLDEVPENANALVEVGGDIKRVPGVGLGGSGGGGVQVAIFKKNISDNTVICDNMTYEDAKALIPSAQLIVVFTKPPLILVRLSAMKFSERFTLMRVQIGLQSVKRAPVQVSISGKPAEYLMIR